MNLFSRLFRQPQRFRTGNSKHYPHKGLREAARRRGELGWRAIDAAGLAQLRSGAVTQ